MIIPAVFKTLHHSLLGALPSVWTGHAAPNGAAYPYKDAGVGSLYVLKGASADATTLYQKIGNAGAAGDWAVLTPTQGVARRVKKLSVTTKTNAEIDTGWDLPAKAIVRDVILDVRTKEDTASTKTIHVGLKSTDSGGDADGFAVGLSTAAAGLIVPKATVTAGATEKYFSSTTRGALLAFLEAGANTAGDVGTYYEFPHVVVSTARRVTYTLGSAHTQIVADIYVVYDEIIG